MLERPETGSRHSLRPIALAAVLAAACLMACGASSRAPTLEPTAANPRLPTVVLESGTASLKAEVARTTAQREVGLMFRTSLPDGTGMLFVFDSDQILQFWMKNTSLPLSIAYLSSDGTIREIHDLEPFSLAGVSSARSVRYALEVPRGWFAKAGLEAGDRFVIPPLD